MAGSLHCRQTAQKRPLPGSCPRGFGTCAIWQETPSVPKAHCKSGGQRCKYMRMLRSPLQSRWQQPSRSPQNVVNHFASRFSHTSLLQCNSPKLHPYRALPFSAIAFCLTSESSAGGRATSFALPRIRQPCSTGLNLTHNLATTSRQTARSDPCC